MKNIPVTQPTLPDLDTFIPLLEDIWRRKYLTNYGKYHEQFSHELCRFLHINNTTLFCNGTQALQTALQALRINGEVITTPFTFVATTHAIYWNHCQPVFCDIDPETLCIDPEKIEQLISPQTSAILPVHIFGIPCDVEEIQKICDNYGLKVIYDAAQAFGVEVNGQSIFHYGDLSIASFHATKIFNTFEGGAVFSHDKKEARLLRNLQNFGFIDETRIAGPGTNGKMSEFQSALGILQLRDFLKIKKAGRAIWNIYKQAFEDMQGIRLIAPQTTSPYSWNYAYAPILIDTEQFGCSRDTVYRKLKKNNLNARRYFFPLVSEFSVYSGAKGASTIHLPVAHEVSRQILCLPMYPGLEPSIQNYIIDTVIECQKGNR